MTERALLAKIDLFMRLHVMPSFDLERINWCFSLSGGKDSFAMAEGLREWYGARGLSFDASGFAIDQWSGPAALAIGVQLPWLRVEVLDGREHTRTLTSYVQGEQAPCRLCANARRDLTDWLLERRRREPGSTTFLARGLHLSDTAVSLAWRFVRGRDPHADLSAAGKAAPIAQLQNGVFLVKPLAYAREYETANYAAASGYRAVCCGCPACRFPSRRDIVEETVMSFFDDPLWEFRVPGAREWLAQFGAYEAEAVSAPGRHRKHGHLPLGFFDFAIDRMREAAISTSSVWARECDERDDLDARGAARLRSRATLVDSSSIPTPALLLHGRVLDPLERAMTATMGPFWGAIALSSSAAARALALQRRCFGIDPDDAWTQSHQLLRDYYAHTSPQRARRGLLVLAEDNR